MHYWLEEVRFHEQAKPRKHEQQTIITKLSKYIYLFKKLVLGILWGHWDLDQGSLASRHVS